METRLHDTTSLCAVCKRSVPAYHARVDGRVLLRKHCPEHGDQEAVISSDADWWERTVAHDRALTPPQGGKPVAQGCPFDCGPCQRHEQRVHLPIVPITSACNLDCPICYTHNQNAGAWHMSEAEIDALLAHLRRAAPDRRIINLTGGEPTQHPDLARIVERCRAEGLHRITLSTHGLRFLRDEALLRRLAELGTRIVLSFDSLDDAGNQAMPGGTFTRGKLDVLALLDRLGVDTTLLPVLAKGVNDHEVGALVRVALDTPCVRSLELHPMTFTGQSGAAFARSARYDTAEVLADVERQTGGAIRRDDFVPSPVAHPLCYQACYLLEVDPGVWVPFLRFMDPGDLRALLAHGLYLEAGPETEARLGDVITRLWAQDGDSHVLGALRRLVEDAFAPGRTADERLRIAERRTKAIYVHTHMDEETFDTDRIRQCPVAIREPDGANVPSCAYNVLYRERDPRFQRHPKPPVATLGPGRID